MTSATKTHGPDAITRIPRPEEPIPKVALPTLALFTSALAVYVGSTFAGLNGLWPVPISVLINGVAAFLMFTVAHECSHASASSNKAINVWLGRLAAPFLLPVGSFSVFRYIHMQHHRFTNHTDGSDPDHYTQAGSRFLLPLRWLTTDLNYFRFYFSKWSSRPRSEKVELFVSAAIVLAAVAALAVSGHAIEVLVYYVIPSRIAVFILAWSFDWLPHHGLSDTVESNKFRATRNIIGGELFLAPLLLYQNYHLVHHLHPRVPFYRYIAVWRKNEESYLANDPAISKPGGRALTVDEYRKLRELDHSH
jgi:ring-1,2-phenylacetyl-CoA epoxidase subunit PaaE